MDKNELEKAILSCIRDIHFTEGEFRKFDFFSSLIENFEDDVSFWVDQFMECGQFFFETEQIEKAHKCFEASFSLDSNNIETWRWLFLSCIVKRDYQSALDVWDLLEEEKEEPRFNDYLYYLILLSRITLIPDKYYEKLEDITESDILIDELEPSLSTKEISYLNQCRISAFKYIVSSYQQMREYIQTKQELHEQISVFEYTTLHLLKIEYQKQKKFRSKLNILLNNKKYREAKEYLEQEKVQRELSNYENNMLKLLNDIIKILDTKRVPARIYNFGKKMDLASAIDDKNYLLALSLSVNYSDENNIPHQSNGILQLLQTIITECSKIELEEKIPSLIYNLKLGNYEDFIDEIEVYLKATNQIQYNFLIADYLKLAYLNQDQNFLEIETLLKDINDGTISIELGKYVELFYKSVAEGHIEEAKIYFDILSHTNILGIPFHILPVLENALDKTIKNSNIQNKSSKFEISEDDCDFYEDDMEPNTSQYNENDLIAMQIIEKNREIVNEKGIVLLDKMDEELEEALMKCVEGMEDLDSFYIDTDEGSKIVLKIKNHYSYDYSKLIRKANQSFSLGDYNQCILVSKKILATENPYIPIYSLLGRSYLYLGDIETAISYLTVVTAISNRHDYSQMIERLKNENNKKTMQKKKDNYFN